MITKIDHKCHHFEEKRDVLTSDINRHVVCVCVCMFMSVNAIQHDWGTCRNLYVHETTTVLTFIQWCPIIIYLIFYCSIICDSFLHCTYTHTTLLLFRAAFKVCLTFMDFRLFLSPIWMVIKWTLLCLRLLHD